MWIDFGSRPLMAAREAYYTMELHITKDQERVLDTWLHDYEKLELRSMWAKEMCSSTEVSAFTKWVEKKSAAFILAYFKKKCIK